MPTAGNAEANKIPQLRLHCGACGASGLIAWQKLDRVLLCSACKTLWRVEANRLLLLPTPRQHEVKVQVRTHSSGWSNHRAIIERPIPWKQWWHESIKRFLTAGKMRWALVAAMVVPLGWTFLTGERSVPAATTLALPEDLAARAVCLAKAVAERDATTLSLLTDPNHHRGLRIWLTHGKEVPAAVAIGNPDLAAKVLEIKELKRREQLKELEIAYVKVQVQLPGDKTALLVEQWEKRSGKWCFQPPRLRFNVPLAKDAAPRRQR